MDTTPAPTSNPITTPDDECFLELRGIYKSFGSLHVLKNISLSFPPGKCTVVLGPSGTGKSVMLKILVRLLEADKGEVWFDGERIDQLSEASLAHVRTQFGFLFQMGALFDSMNVKENICFPLDKHTRMTDTQKYQRCTQVLELIGLADQIEKMPSELSGGQRKRIALARAIALHPRVILYDEPTTGLDPINADVIDRLIIKLQSELYATSIVVTHDLKSAFKVADHMIMLYDGEVIFNGLPDQIHKSKDERIQRFIEGKSVLDKLEHEAASNE